MRGRWPCLSALYSDGNRGYWGPRVLPFGEYLPLPGTWDLRDEGVAARFAGLYLDAEPPDR